MCAPPRSECCTCEFEGGSSQIDNLRLEKSCSLWGGATNSLSTAQRVQTKKAPRAPVASCWTTATRGLGACNILRLQTLRPTFFKLNPLSLILCGECVGGVGSSPEPLLPDGNCKPSKQRDQQLGISSHHRSPMVPFEFSRVCQGFNAAISAGEKQVSGHFYFPVPF